jgi:hypothetical protein
MSAQLLDRILRERFPRPLKVGEALQLLGGPTERTLFRYREQLQETYGAKIVWRNRTLSYEQYPDWCYDLFGTPGAPLATEQKVAMLVIGMRNLEIQTIVVKRKPIELFPAYIGGTMSCLYVVGAQFSEGAGSDRVSLVHLPISDIGAWVGVRKFTGNPKEFWSSFKNSLMESFCA